MVFSGLLFLGIFLPVLLAIYHLSPKNIPLRNGILLTASLLFYGWGEPIRIVFLLLAAYVGYLACRIMDRYRGKASLHSPWISGFCCFSSTPDSLFPM